METPKTTMRLDDETRQLINALVEHLGGNQTTVVKQAVRVLARKEGIKPTKESVQKSHQEEKQKVS